MALYVFSRPENPGLNMRHSTFVPPGAPKEKACAANSLFTTASDYAALMHAWMQDKSPLMQEAFKPQISLIKDNQVFPNGESAEHVDIKVKERLAWGLGLGLELDETGKTVKAFHTGDMNQFRAQMALDLEKKSCIVYFANANKDLEANGHVLGPLIITPKIPVNYAYSWFYSKFPFAFNIEQLNEGSRFGSRVQGPDKKTESDAVMAAFMIEDAPTEIPIAHETKETAHAESHASLEVAREVSQQYKSTLKDTQLSGAAAIEEDVVKAHKVPSPFQKTPKPDAP